MLIVNFLAGKLISSSVFQKLSLMSIRYECVAFGRILFFCEGEFEKFEFDGNLT